MKGITKQSLDGIAKAEAEGRVSEPTRRVDGSMGFPIHLIVPCRVVSEANVRCHWAVRYKRFKRQGDALVIACRNHGFGMESAFLRQNLPLTITFVRLGRQMLDKDDNLNGAFKGLRDKMAAIIGVDDADSELTWRYDQRSGKAGVEIIIDRLDVSLKQV